MALESEKKFREIAIEAIVDYFNSRADGNDKNGTITADDVYIVWECKCLQNNKALLSTTIPDGMYYEFTWNGDKNEGYLDAYKKWEHETIYHGIPTNENKDDLANDLDASGNYKDNYDHDYGVGMYS